MKPIFGKKNLGFTLSEISLALGIAGFCLISILGLLTVGLKGTGDVGRRTEAVEVASLVISDLRGSAGKTESSFFEIPMRSGTTSLFLKDTEGTSKPVGFEDVGRNNSTTAKYRVDVRLASLDDKVLIGSVDVCWPPHPGNKVTSGSGASQTTSYVYPASSRVSVPVAFPIY